MYQGRAVPIFGVMDCHGVQGCLPGPGGEGGATSWAAWLVLYPDCTGPGGDVTWVVVDAVKPGAAGILEGNNAC